MRFFILSIFALSLSAAEIDRIDSLEDKDVEDFENQDELVFEDSDLDDEDFLTEEDDAIADEFDEFDEDGNYLAEGAEYNETMRPRIESFYDKNRFYLFGDLVFFKAIEDSLDYAERLPQTPTFHPKVHRISQHFEYEPGFRLAAGQDFDKKLWTWQGTWMYYTASPSTKHSKDSNFGLFASLIVPEWGAGGNSLTDSVEGKWRLYLNSIDIDIGRNFKLGSFSITPIGGVKAGIIDQRVKIHYKDIAFAFPPVDDLDTPHTIKGKNFFWGVGPLVGVEMNYFTSKSFKFFINGYLSLLAGQFTTKTNYKDFQSPTPPPSDSNVEIKDTEDRISIFEELQAGISKTWVFKKCALDIALGWEVQVWEKQMRLDYFSTFASPSAGFDLSLYGPFARAKFEF